MGQLESCRAAKNVRVSGFINRLGLAILLGETVLIIFMGNSYFSKINGGTSKTPCIFPA